MHLAVLKKPLPGLKHYMAHHVGAAMDHSLYSHSNILFSNGQSASSWSDGGVDIRNIDYDLDLWDFWTLPAHLEPKTHAWYSHHKGMPYDHKGVLRFSTPLFTQCKHSVFCHEAHATAWGWLEPWRYGPGLLVANCRERYSSVLVQDPFTKIYTPHSAVQDEIQRLTLQHENSFNSARKYS